MPSGRKWNDGLADSSVRFFLDTIGDHDKVASVAQESQNTFVVTRREGLSRLRVWLCDVYTLGVADYARIKADDPSINAIVTISGFNSWTREAKHRGYDDGVGVFKFGQFMGALHYEGDDFVQYKPPEHS